jgi:exodeoxyribonuclease-5
MKFSPQQDQALLSVDRWMKGGRSQIFRLFGYAGTGKTTLAKHFAEHVNGGVLYGAYTGKAAYVLRKKGCHGASTIHSMIYNVREKSRELLVRYEHELCRLMSIESPSEQDLLDIGQLNSMIRAEKQNLLQPAFTLNRDSAVRESSLVIIDECSMVNEEMGEDLLSFGTKILVLGDPAQLPPVKGGGYFTGHDPDVMLTEVHRQARDNPILDMATRVRNGEHLPYGSYGASSVVPSYNPNDALSADQILVGMNVTRTGFNQNIRQALGMEGDLPQEGDKLVCLRNSREAGLLNGGLWAVRSVNSVSQSQVGLTICDPDGGDVEVSSHPHHFLGRTDGLNEMPWWRRKTQEEFDYGYALTVHKSQGSQWDNVLLVDESSVFRDQKRSWLYTGITRAAERITVVRRQGV